jgi:uncharacterized membrane protein HdeD (DUF308 family)
VTATPSPSQGWHPWHLPAMRAVPALVVGLPVPFIQLHSPIVGFIALVVLLLGTAAALWLGRSLVPVEAGRWPGQVAAWTALLALIAIVVAVLDASELTLALTVAAWAVPAGTLELLGWWRMRAETDPRTLRLAHDWRAVGVFTILLGVVFLFVRDAVTLTGLLGAYAVIVGVYHALAALSARPARTTTERSEA